MIEATSSILHSMKIMVATIVGVVIASGAVQGSEPVFHPTIPSVQAEERPYALYLELLGKGGVWGVGADMQVSNGWALGAAASFQQLNGQRVWSLSPYVTGYLFHPEPQDRHRWFAQAGPQWVCIVTRSLVPEWEGDHSTGIGVQFSSGYEYRNILLFRAFGMVSLGKGGIAPWLGVDVGCAF